MRRTPFAHIFILTAFIFNSFGQLPVYAQEWTLPKPGVMVRLSPPVNPAVLKGLKINPKDPFNFDFIVDKGDSVEMSHASSLREESARLIKYFLASLTVPEKDLWVNLSPYEKDRIIPTSFGVTEMGRDLLAEDYMLKQITASLIYPEDEVGRKFWKRVYEEAQAKFKTTNIPVNTFNKVWIVPDKAVVYENAKAGTAYVVESKLKVMLETDYLSTTKNVGAGSPGPMAQGGGTPPLRDVNDLGKQIVREVVIPELTREVNEGKNFARLRQVYSSLILAAWYKKKIKDSVLTRVYADKNKVAGVNIADPTEKEKIYQQYLAAFKKGVYNYIKEEPDPVTNERIPRKYFSGGFDMAMRVSLETVDQISRFALPSGDNMAIVTGRIDVAKPDKAMAANKADRAMTVKPKILVVDDDNILGDLMSSYLDLNYDVVVVKSIEAGRQELKKGGYHFVVSDYDLDAGVVRDQLFLDAGFQQNQIAQIIKDLTGTYFKKDMNSNSIVAIKTLEDDFKTVFPAYAAVADKIQTVLQKALQNKEQDKGPRLAFEYPETKFIIYTGRDDAASQKPIVDFIRGNFMQNVEKILAKIGGRQIGDLVLEAVDEYFAREKRVLIVTEDTKQAESVRAKLAGFRYDVRIMNKNDAIARLDQFGPSRIEFDAVIADSDFEYVLGHHKGLHWAAPRSDNADKIADDIKNRLPAAKADNAMAASSKELQLTLNLPGLDSKFDINEAKEIKAGIDGIFKALQGRSTGPFVFFHDQIFKEDMYGGPQMFLRLLELLKQPAVSKHYNLSWTQKETAVPDQLPALIENLKAFLPHITEADAIDAFLRKYVIQDQFTEEQRGRFVSFLQSELGVLDRNIDAFRQRDVETFEKGLGRIGLTTKDVSPFVQDMPELFKALEQGNFLDPEEIALLKEKWQGLIPKVATIRNFPADLLTPTDHGPAIMLNRSETVRYFPNRTPDRFGGEYYELTMAAYPLLLRVLSRIANDIEIPIDRKLGNVGILNGKFSLRSLQRGYYRDWNNVWHQKGEDTQDEIRLIGFDGTPQELKSLFTKEPALMIKIFQEAAQRNVFIDEKILNVMRLVEVAPDEEVSLRNAFDKLISSAGNVSHLLIRMDEVGLLGKVLPKLASVRGHFASVKHKFTLSYHTIYLLYYLEHMEQLGILKLTQFSDPKMGQRILDKLLAKDVASRTNVPGKIALDWNLTDDMLKGILAREEYDALWRIYSLMRNTIPLFDDIQTQQLKRAYDNMRTNENLRKTFRFAVILHDLHKDEGFVHLGSPHTVVGANDLTYQLLADFPGMAQFQPWVSWLVWHHQDLNGFALLTQGKVEGGIFYQDLLDIVRWNDMELTKDLIDLWYLLTVADSFSVNPESANYLKGGVPHLYQQLKNYVNQTPEARKNTIASWEQLAQSQKEIYVHYYRHKVTVEDINSAFSYLSPYLPAEQMAYLKNTLKQELVSAGQASTEETRSGERILVENLPVTSQFRVWFNEYTQLMTLKYLRERRIDQIMAEALIYGFLKERPLTDEIAAQSQAQEIKTSLGNFMNIMVGVSPDQTGVMYRLYGLAAAFGLNIMDSELRSEPGLNQPLVIDHLRGYFLQGSLDLNANRQQSWKAIRNLLQTKEISISGIDVYRDDGAIERPPVLQIMLNAVLSRRLTLDEVFALPGMTRAFRKQQTNILLGTRVNFDQDPQAIDSAKTQFSIETSDRNGKLFAMSYLATEGFGFNFENIPATSNIAPVRTTPAGVSDIFVMSRSYELDHERHALTLQEQGRFKAWLEYMFDLEAFDYEYLKKAVAWVKSGRTLNEFRRTVPVTVEDKAMTVIARDIQEGGLEGIDVRDVKDWTIVDGWEPGVTSRDVILENIVSRKGDIDGIKKQVFVRLPQGPTVFVSDYHHNVFSFWWILAKQGGLKDLKMLHIDAHPDAEITRFETSRENILAAETKSLKEAERYAQGVGIQGFISPFVGQGAFSSSQGRLDWHWLYNLDTVQAAQMVKDEKSSRYINEQGSAIDPASINYGIVDIDLDVFNGYTDDQVERMLDIFADIAAKAKAVSIVTSPEFTDQKKAVDRARRLMDKIAVKVDSAMTVNVKERLDYVQGIFDDLSKWVHASSVVKTLAKKYSQDIAAVLGGEPSADVLKDWNIKLAMLLHADAWLSPSFKSSLSAAKGFLQNVEENGYERAALRPVGLQYFLSQELMGQRPSRDAYVYRTVLSALAAALNELLPRHSGGRIRISADLPKDFKDAVRFKAKQEGLMVKELDMGDIQDKDLLVLSANDLQNATLQASLSQKSARRSKINVIYHSQVPLNPDGPLNGKIGLYGIYDLKALYGQEGSFLGIMEREEYRGNDSLYRFQTYGGLLDGFSNYLMYLTIQGEFIEQNLSKEDQPDPADALASAGRQSSIAKGLKDFERVALRLRTLASTTRQQDLLEALQNITEARLADLRRLSDAAIADNTFNPAETALIRAIEKDYHAALKFIGYIEFLDMKSPQEAAAIEQALESQLNQKEVSAVPYGQKTVLYQSGMAALVALLDMMADFSPHGKYLTTSALYFETESLQGEKNLAIKPTSVDGKDIDKIASLVASGEYTGYIVEPISNMFYSRARKDSPVNYPAFDLKGLMGRLAGLTFTKPFFLIIDDSIMGTALKDEDYLAEQVLPDNLIVIRMKSLQKLHELGQELSSAGAVTVMSSSSQTTDQIENLLKKIRSINGAALTPLQLSLLNVLGFNYKEIDERTQKINANAMTLARFLNAKKEAGVPIEVYYPGLEDHANYKTAQSNYTAFGPFVVMRWAKYPEEVKFAKLLQQRLIEAGVSAPQRDSFGFDHMSFSHLFDNKGFRVSLGTEDTEVLSRILNAFDLAFRDMEAEAKDTLAADNAQIVEKGGIDFNTDKLNLQIKDNGGKIDFTIDAKQLAQLQNAPGFMPVIMNIQPMVNLPEFLGIPIEAP